MDVSSIRPYVHHARRSYRETTFVLKLLKTPQNSSNSFLPAQNTFTPAPPHHWPLAPVIYATTCCTCLPVCVTHVYGVLIHNNAFIPSPHLASPRLIRPPALPPTRLPCALPFSTPLSPLRFHSVSTPFPLPFPLATHCMLSTRAPPSPYIPSARRPLNRTFWLTPTLNLVLHWKHNKPTTPSFWTPLFHLPCAFFFFFFCSPVLHTNFIPPFSVVALSSRTSTPYCTWRTAIPSLHLSQRAHLLHPLYTSLRTLHVHLLFLPCSPPITAHQKGV